MRALNFRIFSFASFLLLVFVFLACEKDEENNKPYYGKWESEVYPLQNPANGDTTKWEKMSFTFTNTTFHDVIYQGLSKSAVILALEMGGTINNSSANNLDAEINEITYNTATVKKQSDPDLFLSVFASTLNDRLYETFTATYEVSGDTLIFTIPLKNPAGGTINKALRLKKVK